MSYASGRPTWIETDLDAIAHNTHILHTHAGSDIQLMAVLKADAYGHGALHVARAALAHGATHLALATLDEAATLRQAGIDAPILLLGYTPPWQAHAAAQLGLAVTIFDAEVTCALATAAESLGQPVIAHVKVDTGMSRLGLMPDRVLAFMRWARTLPGLVIKGIYTHLATADGDWTMSEGRVDDRRAPLDQRAYAHMQLDRFDALLDTLRAADLCPPLVHAANSAALLRMSRAVGCGMNLVRPGLALYGIAPFDPVAEHDERVRNVAAALRPALSWRTRIARVADLPADTPVSYGATYRTSGVCRIATLPVGYADGLRRSPPWHEVLVRGQRAPIVGRICMDYVMCDVSAIYGAAVGDVVTLIGADGEERITVEEVADWLDTSVYEVLTSIGGRVPRYASFQDWP